MANKFIELTEARTHKKFISNTAWIEAVIPSDKGVVVYVASTYSGAVDQDYYRVEESYEEIKAMLMEVSQ